MKRQSCWQCARARHLQGAYGCWAWPARLLCLATGLTYSLAGLLLLLLLSVCTQKMASSVFMQLIGSWLWLLLTALPDHVLLLPAVTSLTLYGTMSLEVHNSCVDPTRALRCEPAAALSHA